MLRNVDVSVISDVHLGTYGCHAEELLMYLQSIKPRVLIINGDFIDAWQFRKKFFPRAHLELIRQVIDMAINGVKVYYITGNHDDVLRKFSDMSIGLIHLKDSLILQLDGKKYWFFHGDIFDASIMISPRLAALGGRGYDFLIRFNRAINKVREGLGKPRVSFSKNIKDQVKRAVSYVSDFETLAVRHGARMQCDYVVCGHIHKPVIRRTQSGDREVTYMNSGDWIENLTALEFGEGTWTLFHFEESELNNRPRPKITQEDSVPSASMVRSRVLDVGSILRLW